MPTPFLEGGELLLTTGLALTPDMAEGYVRRPHVAGTVSEVELHPVGEVDAVERSERLRRVEAEQLGHPLRRRLPIRPE